ncbi:PQ loop repeat-domain-containing protein [Geopyxis carbonaria]|nr:PQ loop repeat-domain-containing protein [Geopyxis carbonaria]
MAFDSIHDHYHPLPPGLPPHCDPDTPLLVAISRTFGTCIPSYMSLLSITCGLLSIVSWLFAQMPQIWKNYSRGSVEGLSLGFLAIWLAGDVCNLLGALWTGQMWFQQVVGAYYVFVDCVLVCQFFYFHNAAGRLEGLDDIDGQSIYHSDVDDDDYLGDSESDAEDKKRQPPSRRHTHGRSRSLASTLVVVVSLMARVAGASPLNPGSTVAMAGGVVVSRTIGDSTISFEELGKVLSWFSTFLYLSSRIPQLLLNFRRRSTSGLAIQLFVAAFFGNFFYSASLLLNPLGHADYPPNGHGGLAPPEGSDHLEWWSRTLPFFLGAAGVLVLDAAVGWQWWIWGERTPILGYSIDDEEYEDLIESPAWKKWWPWNGWWADRRIISAADECKPLVVHVEDGRIVAAVYGT